MKCYIYLMGHFIKSNFHALLYGFSSSGRDSRRTFCDICEGFILLALAGIFLCAWRNTLAILLIRDWLVISEEACWVLCFLFEAFLIVAFINAVIRRWQDLDIRIPKEESVRDLVQRARFWEVLTREEGSSEKNQYGPAPADNPAPLVNEEDLKAALRKKLFVDVDSDIEQIK